MNARLLVLSVALASLSLVACSGASNTGFFDGEGASSNPVLGDGDAGTKKLGSIKKDTDSGADEPATKDAGVKTQKTPVCALTNVELPNTKCHTCWGGACCAQWKTCDKNPDCLKLQTCVNKCAPNDSECIQDCAALYPDGRDDIVALYQCGEKSCAAECE